MKWKSLGLIYSLPEKDGFTTHAQVPTPMVFEDYVRVYYAGRMHGMSYPAFFDICRKDMKTILDISPMPIMPWGDPGMFDSDGIMPSTVMRKGKEIWMYYTGWNEKTRTARYHNAIGLAVSRDEGRTFVQKYDGPILDRTKDYPGLAVTPFVKREGKIWKMWYISGVSWTCVHGTYEPQYVIKYAVSGDGINWSRCKQKIVNSESDLQAFSNPCVIRKGHQYHMWFCYRDSFDYRGGIGSYKIGYATSDHGVKFEINPDPQGLWHPDWACTMLCYPYVIEIDGKIYMFYNGNNFGKSGIGLAVLEGI